MAARRRGKRDETALLIGERHGRKTVCVEMDVTSTASVDAGVAGAVDALGTPTIVINNAGISREAFALDTSDDDYDAVIETNLNGVFRVARATGKAMAAEALALEWSRYGIRVNAIAPGFFVTDINREFFGTPQSDTMMKRVPMRRPGELPELDGALLLLASDAGANMTGSTITVDGGHAVNSL